MQPASGDRLALGSADVPQEPTSKDLLCYSARYPDLSAAFGNDTQALLRHWHRHGRAEHREVYCEAQKANVQAVGHNTTKSPRVALLNAHMEGNLGDEYETTPLLRKLADWGAEVDVYSAKWLDPSKQLNDHTKENELIWVHKFYTSDQWQKGKLPGGVYDMLLCAPGPTMHQCLQKENIELAASMNATMAVVGTSESRIRVNVLKRVYNLMPTAESPLRLVIMRDPESFRLAASKLGIKDIYTEGGHLKTDVSDSHVRLMLSGDLSWSFAPSESALQKWKLTYHERFLARFGSAEPWYVLFLRNVAHLREGSNASHLVLKVLGQDSTMVVPVARTILASSDMTDGGDVSVMSELQSRLKLAADDIIAPESVEQMLGLLGCLGPNSSLVVISDRYHPAMAAGRMETTVKLLGNDDIDAYSSFDAVKMHGAYEMLSNYSSSDILGLNNAAWSALAEEIARPKYSYMKAR